MYLLSDYLRVNQLTMQTWTACLQTIRLRSELVATHPPMSNKVMTENVRMSTEKIAASLEVSAQLQAGVYDLYQGQFNPLKTWEKMLKPINKTATGNASRLSRQVK